MSTKLLVSLIAGVVVIGGAVFIFGGGTSDTAMTGSENAPSNESATQATSIKALLASGSAQKCTFTHAVENIESSGTVYVSNGKLRGDFMSKTSGQTVQSHMIVDGETSYVWTDLAAQGFKIPVSKLNEQGTAGASQSQNIDINQELNYSCSGWNGDASIFVAPSNVTFSDLGAMMNTQCGSCDLVPDANAKAQCKAALGCR